MTGEKRFYPRVSVNIGLSLRHNAEASAFDLSEGGIGFAASGEACEPGDKLLISIKDPDFNSGFNLRMKWKKRNTEGSFIYGGEFFNLRQKQKEGLRRWVIARKISPLLKKAKSAAESGLILRFFTDYLSRYMDEIISINVALAAGNAYSLEYEEKLDKLSIKALLSGSCLEECLENKEILGGIKNSFRQLAGPWIYKSEILKRAFDKPSGYPGDYELLEMIYNNRPVSGGIGAYFDNIFLRSPYITSVRQRKDKIKLMLLSAINDKKPGRVNVLSVGCGPCREIRELLPDLNPDKEAHFTCVDWDEKALSFSRHMIMKLHPHKAIFKFCRCRLKDILRIEPALGMPEKQDVIYSTGFFDYLPRRVFKKLIRSLFTFLAEGGKLIITHKNREMTMPQIHPEWLCDWNLMPRNKDEFIKLIYESGIKQFSISVSSDNFGYIHYFVLSKDGMRKTRT